MDFPAEAAIFISGQILEQKLPQRLARNLWRQSGIDIGKRLVVNQIQRTQGLE